MMASNDRSSAFGGTFRLSIPSGKDPSGVVQAMVPSGSQTLRITGMTCASCVATIERALRATPGVEHATVNLATGLAQQHRIGSNRHHGHAGRKQRR